jgi:hypothetical protein
MRLDHLSQRKLEMIEVTVQRRSRASCSFGARVVRQIFSFVA